MNQSREYEIAMITGMAEFWVEYLAFPILRLNWFTFWLGFFLCLSGGLLRAVAEIQMQGNFNHHIQTSKSEEHQLVTTGLYSYRLMRCVICRFFRHPAYTGWFYFSIGTQVLLNNPICTLLYMGAAWYFFYDRIPYEERFLLSFFSEYEEYRNHTHIFIPFIPKVQKPLANKCRVCSTKRINLIQMTSAYGIYQIELAEEAIFGQRSAASFATGPVIPDPFISPLGFTITPALSRNQPDCQNKPSKYKNTPFFLLQAFLCLTTIAGMTRLSNTRGQRNTLLTKLRLSLLDGSNEHIANS